MVIVFGSTGIVKFAASVSDFGYLMGLGIVNYAVIALHRKMPNLRRPFKVILYPYIPIPALETRSFLLGGLLTFIGGAIYLSRSANRAELFNLDKTYSKLNIWIQLLKKKRMKVLIIDGGRIGRNIADRLLAKDELRLMFRSVEHQIIFIEEDEKICTQLETRYHMPIIQGDGKSRRDHHH